MIYKGIKKFSIIFLVCLAIVLAAGCTGTESSDKSNTGSAADSGSKEVVLVSTPYDTELSSGNVIKQVLDANGYDVDLKVVDVGLAFQGIASGSGDFFVGAWLPTCHGQYYDKYKDDMVLVSENMVGTRCGLVVPAYVDVNSIEELKDHSDIFDSAIVGIEPGAGIMKSTEIAAEEYGLDYEVSSGSEVAMCTALKSALDKKEPIVVTGWSPHWMFVKWDLKYLDDPENVYGGIEHITTFTREGFKDDYPELYEFLERYHWESSDMESIMLDVNEGMDVTEAASKWIKNNPDLVNEWLGK
ncbi:glycine betaine ABC transporter substrate-binding protein [Methanoplanus endosymbiosus]|uniref:Glycine betaine ABC transporter substrate-binding protein n=1 Tax=Methanoplanus endosymbiosus TaxID=33865 RepID=A0A9E7PMJ2_9EURY|nr:glycine betaine ABC transporter substrate-binding protein [Methanoplanus endosymbiosus]UUX92958.1 glycine betaine ABC transporter substrate-binding protein [Methanoplanus endosymbiosus]